MADPARKELNPLVNSDDQAGAGQPLRYASDPDPDQQTNLPSIELPEVQPEEDFQGRCQQVLQLAEEAFAKTGSWVVFFREVLGTHGVVSRLFPSSSERREFTQSEHYATLQEMLAAIRSQDQSKSDAAEPERMITIRIPRSLHEALQEEAKECNLSINKLAISKLLQPANPRFVPEQQGRRRGRRPGPQGPRTQHTRNNTELPQEPATTNRLSNQGVSIERGSVHSWANSVGGESREQR